MAWRGPHGRRQHRTHRLIAGSRPPIGLTTTGTPPLAAEGPALHARRSAVRSTLRCTSRSRSARMSISWKPSTCIRHRLVRHLPTGRARQARRIDRRHAPSARPGPGKITVYDFWADWCKPCGELDHELAEVARRHPDDIAVRKINVVDADSPASQTYLGAATLPHLKVFESATARYSGNIPPRRWSDERGRTRHRDLETDCRHPGARRIAIDVTGRRLRPDRIEIEQRKPSRSCSRASPKQTCAFTDVHFAIPDGTGSTTLPLGSRSRFRILSETRKDPLLACGMNMNHGRSW